MTLSASLVFAQNDLCNQNPYRLEHWKESTTFYNHCATIRFAHGCNRGRLTGIAA